MHPILDNISALNKLRAYGKYSIDAFIKSYGKKYVTRKDNEPSSFDQNLPDFGMVNPEFHKRALSRLCIMHHVKKGSTYKLVPKCDCYSYFDFRVHKNVTVNCSTGKIISMS